MVRDDAWSVGARPANPASMTNAKYVSAGYRRRGWEFGIFSPLLFALLGCSLRWTEPDGTERHVGTIRYEIRKTDEGTEISRTTFGLDISLSGPLRGFMLGVRNITELVPKTIMTKNSQELGQSIASFFRSDISSSNAIQKAGQEVVHSGWFDLKEDGSKNARYLESSAIGIEWNQGSVGDGFSIGYSALSSYVGLHSESSEALIRAVEQTPPYRRRFLRWPFP